MTRDGEGVPVSLDDNGGKLAFDGAGAYVLTATVRDELGKEYTADLPLEVCPVIVLTLDAPETAHIDQPAAVSLTGTDLDVVWEVTSEAGAAIENSLTNEIKKWCGENMNARKVDEGLFAEGEYGEEMKYFKRAEKMKEMISHQFMNLEEGFLDSFVDDYYPVVFEQGSEKI